MRQVNMVLLAFVLILLMAFLQGQALIEDAEASLRRLVRGKPDGRRGHA
jgi:hypothetical protein